jgi:hypothetical protein
MKSYKKNGCHFINDKKPKNMAMKWKDQLEGMKGEIFQ